MNADMCNALSYDPEVLKAGIVDLMEGMSVERLRMLYITALVWEEKE